MTSLLAEYTHRHHSSYEEDIPFWLELANQQGGPALELGCGTGRVLLRLAEAGFSVWGIDHDRETLEVLKAQLTGKEHQELVLHEDNMASFQMAMQFSLILMPCNTYSTLVKEERLSTLESVNSHLSPGGVFAASVPNPEWMAQLPEETEPEMEIVFTHPSSKNPVQVSSAWQRARDKVVVSWHYDHLFPDGRVERTSMEAHHYLTKVEEYLGEFESLGLKVIPYGDFKTTPYNSQSVYLILVGTKSEN
jgi:SAM-dependent methyltransferase